MNMVFKSNISNNDWLIKKAIKNISHPSSNWKLWLYFLENNKQFWINTIQYNLWIEKKKVIKWACKESTQRKWNDNIFFFYIYSTSAVSSYIQYLMPICIYVFYVVFFLFFSIFHCKLYLSSQRFLCIQYRNLQ